MRKNIEAYKFVAIENLTASFGVSIFNPSDTGDSLLARADDALYKAKENGRNRVESSIS
jgi:PleD family two-component response regulator